MIPQPLNGIRVIDLSRLLPGPYCTMLLADLGADVTKIETPRIGDYARMIPDTFGGEEVFAAVNHNKKSVALNYRSPRGREVLLRLARDADVFVESFRPGAVEHWQLDYESVRAVNPRIVYCSLSGYGQSGPYRDRAGHDLNYVALGGLLGLIGAAGGPPIPPGVQIADQAGAMLAAMAILGALVGRERSGEGAYLDVSMLDVVVSWLGPVAGAQYFHTGDNPERGRMYLSGALPCYNVYQTADGRFITLAALEGKFWTAFCSAVERDDLQPRQFDGDATSVVADLFRSQTWDEWVATFDEVDACVEPVNTVEEALRNPQVRHRGLVEGEPTRRIESPFQFTTRTEELPPPALGEHTWQVLSEAGLSDEEIRDLEAEKVIRTGQPSRDSG